MNEKKTRKPFQLKPAQVLVLGFALTILLGAILLNLPIATQSGKSVGLVNAIFTSTSAVCVTGLAVVDTGTYWSVFGQSVILLLIQIGGLGFMTMGTSIAIILGKKISLRNRLIIQEALNQFSISGVVRLTKYIVMTTLGIEAVGALLLSFRFVPEFGWAKGIFFSIFHSISAFCNAGFDLIGNGQSFMPYVGDVLINFTLMTLLILGGLGFVVMIDVAKKKRFRDFSLHTKFALSMTAILLIVSFLMFFVFEFNNPATLGNLSGKDKVLGAMFQAATPRTAGFNTLPTGELNNSSKFWTTVLMFIGGSPGSTAGGVKTTTIGLVLLTVLTVIRGKEDTEIFNRRIKQESIMRAVAILMISLSIVIFVTLMLTITEPGLAFSDIFFESVSAFGTVGLSTGITGSLSVAGKLIVAMTMFFGRVGPLTIVFALAQRNRKKALIRYPSGKIMIG